MPDPAPDLRKEYFETAREEILWRIGHRDQWLKIQLLAQIAIFGLANGVDFGFVKSGSPIDLAVAFAFPTSLVLAIFYVVEDRLIGLAGAYLGALAHDLSPAGADFLLPFDASPQLRRYAEEGTLLVRLFGQVLAFAGLPVAIVTLGAVHKAGVYPGLNPGFNSGVLLISFGCALFVVILLAWSFLHRRTAGTVDENKVLVDSWPKAETRLSQLQRVVFIIVILVGLVSVAGGLWALR